jgi:flagellar transcriptional activator FlhD
MNSERLLNEIRELNLSYLVLAQAAIQSDKAGALFRLGMSEAVADMVAQLSPQQLVRVASRNQMLCAFRFDDELIWGLLTDSHQPRAKLEGNAGLLHASVLMAGGRETLAKA